MPEAVEAPALCLRRENHVSSILRYENEIGEYRTYVDGPAEISGVGAPIESGRAAHYHRICSRATLLQYEIGAASSTSEPVQSHHAEGIVGRDVDIDRSDDALGMETHDVDKTAKDFHAIDGLHTSGFDVDISHRHQGSAVVDLDAGIDAAGARRALDVLHTEQSGATVPNFQKHTLAATGVDGDPI